MEQNYVKLNMTQAQCLKSMVIGMVGLRDAGAMVITDEGIATMIINCVGILQSLQTHEPAALYIASYHIAMESMMREFSELVMSEVKTTSAKFEYIKGTMNNEGFNYDLKDLNKLMGG